VLDEEVTMETGTIYGIRFRRSDGTSVNFTVNTVPGQTKTLTFATPVPIASGPQAGDLAMFGVANSETAELIVKTIERGPNYTAKIICMDYAPEVQNADSGEIPVYDPHVTTSIDITKLKPSAPQIISVESGTAALLISGGSFISRILVTLANQGGFVQVGSYNVRFRQFGSTSWQNASAMADAPVAALSPVVDGEIYEIQAQAISVYGIPSDWSSIVSETVLGQEEVPGNVTDFSISIIDGAAHASWDAEPSVDLSHYRIRWSPLLIGASWGSSTDIIAKVAMPATTAVMPAIVGTYLIKAVDYAGNESVTAATASTSIARVQALNVVSAISAPTWTGSGSGALYDAARSGIVLAAAGDLYNAADLYAISDLYHYGGYTASGTFPLGNFDLGNVYTSRISSSITVTGFNYAATDLYLISDLYDSADLYAVGETGYSAAVQIRTTNDDPAGTPTWSAWANVSVGDMTCRAYEARIILYGTQPDITPVVEAAALNIDMPDRVLAFAAAISSGGSRVVFNPPFYAFPNDEGLGISVINGQEGDKYTISSLDETGFNIAFTNGGLPVGRSISGVAKSYGSKEP
jgi:hypothetical protein